MSVYKSIFKSLLVLFLFGIVCGFDIPSYEGYITDKVGVFSETEKADLHTKIQEIEQATSIEIAVLVVPTVDDDINLVAADVGNTRGVGKKGQNNGLVLVIAVNDRKWSIQVGYGLEGILPDIITKRIGEEDFPPNFREGKYYQGIIEMLDDILGYIKQDPTILQKYTKDHTTDSFDDDQIAFIFIMLFFFLPLFGRRVTVPRIKGKGRKMKKYGRRIYAGTGLVLTFLITLVIASFLVAAIISYIFLLFSILIALFGGLGGRGVSDIWFGGSGGGSSRGGGSSFGGFGGGSFGGGGSSGSR